MTGFGDPRDSDGMVPGDNLYGPPDPGFTSSYYKQTSRPSIGDGGLGFLYLMSLLISAPLLSVVPIIWPICIRDLLARHRSVCTLRIADEHAAR